MPLTSIVMPYKENCKTEGEIMTGFKIARMYFADGEKQKDIAAYLRCHPNTVNGIIGKCRISASPEAWLYLKTSHHISRDQLQRLFSFFEHDSRRPHSHKDSLRGDAKRFICGKFGDLNYGHKRLFRHLRRKGYDVKDTFTLGKIKGVYKRQEFKVKKIRTASGERRALYNYDEIGAFEYLQYDTKEIPDKHSLPAPIYEKFKNSKILPKYQWTIVDAKSKVRFLAWSYSLCSLFGLKFLEFTICWLRAHGIQARIHTQIDGGPEFCSASEKKLANWNNYLSKYNAWVYDTGGVKWKQNLVERTHRTDDEEFYCPRGDLINTKTEFMVEGQFWIIYYNNRSSDAIGLNGISPKEKLEQLGIYNAESICNFPCLILEDFFQPFQTFFNTEINQKNLGQKSQNVLTPYPIYGPAESVVFFTENIRWNTLGVCLTMSVVLSSIINFWIIAGTVSPNSTMEFVPYFKKTNSLSVFFYYLPKGVAWCFVRIPAACVMIGKFVPKLLVLIYSDIRLLCSINAAVGAAIGWFAGSAIVGALAGGMFGVLNYWVVSVKYLKLN